MESGMKITAGLGGINDYISFGNAGADEVFAGFVPWEWNREFKNTQPLNRREVLFYHVQIGSFNELKILKKMQEKYKIPVAIVFNALYYTEPQISFIISVLKKLTETGFCDFIICDFALILAIIKENISCSIHISGEIGEWNHNTLKMLLEMMGDSDNQKKTRFKRVIFHRKNTLKDMEKIIAFGRAHCPKMEYEAFFMNEKCHFTGGFCNSLHCDELPHLCQVPYRLVPVERHENTDPVLEKWEQRWQNEEEFQEDGIAEPEMIPGETGCGLCALWKLQEIGITHLKIVGRGKSPELMRKDVEIVKKAMKILQSSSSEDEYKKEMKKALFPNGKCSGNCYYPETSEEK